MRVRGRMDFTPEEAAHFKAEAARRRRMAYVAVAVPLVPLVGAGLFWPSLNRGLWEFLMFVWVAFSVIFASQTTWRCPACNSYLGRFRRTSVPFVAPLFDKKVMPPNPRLADWPVR